MQGDAVADHYARHEELFKKRLALLRESLELVEQRRRLTKKRPPPSEAFKRIILRLKQSQADAEAVKGKNRNLLQTVDDILMQKQAHLLMKPNIKESKDGTMSRKELCWEESLIGKENILDNTSIACSHGEKELLNACDVDAQKQHQATSHIKLQDLGCESKRFNIDISSHLPITSTIPCQEVTTRTSEKPAHYDSMELQGPVQHKTSKLTERLALQPVSLGTMIEPSLASINGQEICYESQVLESLIDSSRVHIPASTNELTLMACSSIQSLEDDFNKRDTQATFNNSSEEQDGQLLMYHHRRHLEQKEHCNTLCAKLERSEPPIAGDGAPSRFLVANVGNQLHDQDRTFIKRKRAELAIFPSKEKLRILDNIYNAIYQWENTLWAYECEQIWDPGLVFSTIEAARGGDEEVKELLKSKDSGSRLLLCCEAICELMHTFPPESLVPAEFVKNCLLATSEANPDVHQWVQNNQLATYQDVDSSMFWDSLTRHAMYLVTHELATAKQIASIFTGILLPTSRLKDSSKGEYETARLNLHIFIAILLGAKDAAAASSLKAKGRCISDGQDCPAQIVVYKDDDRLEMQERYGSASLIVAKVPMCGTNQAEDEVSSTSAAPANAPSCLSCSMLVKCLPWKKSKPKTG